MINRFLQGKQPIIYGDGTQKRCFSFMDDVLQPMLVACESEVADGKVINIGPDEEFISIYDLGRHISEIMNIEYRPLFMPGRPQEVKNANCSADLAREILQYKTSTSLDDGLRSLIDWVRKVGPREFDYHLPLEFITSDTPLTWVNKLI